MGYFATFLTFLGIILSANKKQSCWVIWMIANVVWTLYALHPLQIPLILTQLILFAGNCYGLLKWK